MPPAPSRRRFVRLAGTAFASGLAGCSQSPESTAPPAVTPAPVPSDGPTSTMGPGRPRTTPDPDAIGFEVSVRSGFTEASPARLEIAFWNAGRTRLTAVDGPAYSLPFVDDDYAAPDGTGEAALMLVPDGATLAVDPEGLTAGSVGEFLPDEPSDGCWSVPFDWPAARDASTLRLLGVSLEPSDRRQHAYGLYFVDDCAPGTYRFVNTFDLAAGDPPYETDLVRARTSFEVGVSASMAVEVRVHEPELTPPRDDE